MSILYSLAFYPDLKIANCILTFSDNPSTTYMVLGYIPISIYEAIIDEAICGIIPTSNGISDSLPFGITDRAGLTINQSNLGDSIYTSMFVIDRPYTGHLDNVGVNLSNDVAADRESQAIAFQDKMYVGIAERFGQYISKAFSGIRRISLKGLTTKGTIGTLSWINGIIIKEPNNLKSPKIGTDNLEIYATQCFNNGNIDDTIYSIRININSSVIKSISSIKIIKEFIYNNQDIILEKWMTFGELVLENNGFIKPMSAFEIKPDIQLKNTSKLLDVANDLDSIRKNRSAASDKVIKIMFRKRLNGNVDLMRIFGNKNITNILIAKELMLSRKHKYRMTYTYPDIQGKRDIYGTINIKNETCGTRKQFHESHVEKRFVLWKIINKIQQLSDIHGFRISRKINHPNSTINGIRTEENEYNGLVEVVDIFCKKNDGRVISMSEIISHKDKRLFNKLTNAQDAVKSDFITFIGKTLLYLYKFVRNLSASDDIKTALKSDNPMEINKELLVNTENINVLIDDDNEILTKVSGNVELDKIEITNKSPVEVVIGQLIDTDKVGYDSLEDKVKVGLPKTNEGVVISTPGITVKLNKMVKVFTQVIGNSVSERGNIFNEWPLGVYKSIPITLSNILQGVYKLLGYIFDSKVLNMLKIPNIGHKQYDISGTKSEEIGITKPETVAKSIQSSLIKEDLPPVGDVKVNRLGIITEELQGHWDDTWLEIWKLHGKGLDKLQIPDKDYYYAKDIAEILNHNTGEIYQALSPVNTPMVKVAKCIEHPLPEFSEVGREDHNMKKLVIKASVLVDMMLLIRQLTRVHWQKYMLMTSQATLMHLLENLYGIIEETLYSSREYRKAFQMVRWYAEAIALYDSNFYINRHYEQWLSKEYHGYIGEPGEVVNNGWSINSNSIIYTNQSESSLTLNLTNWVDGYLAFSTYTDNIEAKIDLYIDDIKVLTTGTVNQVRQWVLMGQHNIKFVFSGPVNTTGYLSGISLEGCKFTNAEMIVKAKDDKPKGKISSDILLSKLLKYYADHHFDKTKGTREQWIESITQIKIDD